jgi:signal transduction histidine kinase
LARSHARPGADARERRPPNPLVVGSIAVAGVAAGGSSFEFALTNEAIGSDVGEPLVIATLWDWMTLTYLLGGLVAWRCRPASRLGLLMIAAGFVCFLDSLTWTTSDVSFTLGQAVDKLPPVIFLHLFLAFPSGRLTSRFERRLVALAYAIAVGTEPIRMMLGDYGPHNLLGVAPHADAADAARKAQLLVLSALLLTGVAVLAVRRRRAGPPFRRSATLLIDAFSLGLVMVAALYTLIALDGPAVTEARWAALLTLGLAPLAFVICLLHSRLARSAVADLFVELQSSPSPATLRDALARSLRDPSLELVYWLPEFESWADLEGNRVELPAGADTDTRSVTLIDRDGTRMAALVHDPALEREPELLAGVGAAAAIALENGRLQAELRARLDELMGSRARVIEAGQRERQRLERNLHDGAQQRLIALSLELGLLEEGADPETRARLDQARGEIATSLDELRAVAHGLHPAVVTGHGLAIALEQIAARAPVPVELTIDLERRLPEPIEVAAYYVVSESLANIGKHARASAATIAVTQSGGRVVIEIADDGLGGADSETGSGIRGLADRVEALNGRLRIWSPENGGTRVVAEMPCA